MKKYGGTKKTTPQFVAELVQRLLLICTTATILPRNLSEIQTRTGAVGFSWERCWRRRVTYRASLMRSSCLATREENTRIRKEQQSVSIGY